MSLDYSDLPDQFQAFATARGSVLTTAAQLDALAAFLSCQMLLVAGPSGTGKSTLARLLGDFFTPRFEVIEAEVALMRQQETAGYASALRNPPQFMRTEHTDALAGLAGSSSSATPGVPTLLVEEGNLSPMEGYLRPFVHGLSSSFADRVTWPVHEDPTISDPPRTLDFAPWPRLLATINVDATAPAPAPKVVSRGAVLLLEPPELATAVGSHSSLFAAPSSIHAPAADVAGDPRAALYAATQHGTAAALADILGDTLSVVAAGERNLVSNRAATKSLMYLAAYDSIASGTGLASEWRDNRRLDGAENALLHFVLPTLDAGLFGEIAERARLQARPGGLLADRLARLRGNDRGFGGVPEDFWTGLS